MNRAKKLLKEAQRPRRTVPLCLRGDLLAQMEDLDRQLREATAKPQAGSLAGDGAARELAERIEALRTQMTDHILTVTVEAVARARWSALVAAHPPRDGHKDDARVGVNEDAFFEAILPESVVDPVLDAEDWASLDEVLTDAQWTGLCNAVWAVNRRDVDVPFSFAASQILQTSAGG